MEKAAGSATVVVAATEGGGDGGEAGSATAGPGPPEGLDGGASTSPLCSAEAAAAGAAPMGLVRVCDLLLKKVPGAQHGA